MALNYENLTEVHHMDDLYHSLFLYTYFVSFTYILFKVPSFDGNEDYTTLRGIWKFSSLCIREPLNMALEPSQQDHSTRL